MTIEDFKVIAEARFAHCLSLMCGEKHKEYSRNNDKLHNFKVAGQVDDETPERALWGMYKKHLVSIMDIVNDIESAYQKFGYVPIDVLPSPERIAAKFSDDINYKVLLEALIVERRITNANPGTGKS